MTEERIRELTKAMLRKKLYVVLSKGGAAAEEIAKHLPRHLEIHDRPGEEGRAVRVGSAGGGRRQDSR